MESTSIDAKAGSECLKSKLKDLAGEISSELARLDSNQSRELLSDFVSELFFNLAKQSQQELRRQRQAEGIAAAKAQGVRFGAARKPLPDNFSECYEAWKRGQMTQTQAAEICGISRATFRREANRLKQDESCSV